MAVQGIGSTDPWITTNDGIQKLTESYLGKSTRVSTRFAHTIVGIIKNIFSKVVLLIEDNWIALKDKNSKPAIDGYKAIHEQLMNNLYNARTKIESEDPQAGYNLLKGLLLLKAEIDVSSFGLRLRDPKKIQEYKNSRTAEKTEGNVSLRDASFICKDYKKFCDQLKALHRSVKENCQVKLNLKADDIDPNKLNRTDDYENAYQIYRWINSTSQQRRIAAVTPTKMLPLKAEEVPAGAVLLTNVDLWYKALKLRGLNPKLNQFLRSIKGVFNLLFTGKNIIHAEISLGSGKFLHQDDSKKESCVGITTIEDRGAVQKGRKIKPTIITHEVVVPMADRMGKKQGDLEAAIGRMKDKESIQVRTSPVDIIKCGLSHLFPSKKKKGFQSPDYLNDLDGSGVVKKGLSCSATVAALYRSEGIEVGTNLGKTVDEINPADFTRTGMFKPLYASGMIVHEDPVTRKKFPE